MFPRTLSLMEASAITRREIARRTIKHDLIVPSWVMKDHAFYKKVRAKNFKTQRSLDRFVTDEAARRHRQVVSFEGRKVVTYGSVLNVGPIRRRPKQQVTA